MPCLVALQHSLENLFFTICSTHHQPKYTIEIVAEKVTPLFSDPKTWELTPLPHLLLSVLRLHKRKEAVSEDFNQRADRFKAPQAVF